LMARTAGKKLLVNFVQPNSMPIVP